MRNTKSLTILSVFGATCFLASSHLEKGSPSAGALHVPRDWESYTDEERQEFKALVRGLLPPRSTLSVYIATIDQISKPTYRTNKSKKQIIDTILSDATKECFGPAIGESWKKLKPLTEAQLRVLCAEGFTPSEKSGASLEEEPDLVDPAGVIENLEELNAKIEAYGEAVTFSRFAGSCGYDIDSPEGGAETSYLG